MVKDMVKTWGKRGEKVGETSVINEQKKNPLLGEERKSMLLLNLLKGKHASKR